MFERHLINNSLKKIKFLLLMLYLARMSYTQYYAMKLTLK